jgi:hypothetical protein
MEASSIASGNSSGSTTTNTTPKLKLTFKLSEIRAASPAPSSDPPVDAPQKRAPKRKKTDAFATPYKKPKNKLASSVDELVKPVPTRLQFPEQVAFVQEMRQFRARKWRHEPCELSLLGGRTVLLSGWNRERTTKPSKSMTPTFVCTFEGCHKIFDAKDKWRRHQNLHKKKLKKEAAVGLQLKLDIGAMKAKAAATESANASTSTDHNTII